MPYSGKYSQHNPTRGGRNDKSLNLKLSRLEFFKLTRAEMTALALMG